LPTQNVNLESFILTVLLETVSYLIISLIPWAVSPYALLPMILHIRLLKVPFLCLPLSKCKSLINPNILIEPLGILNISLIFRVHPKFKAAKISDPV